MKVSRIYLWLCPIRKPSTYHFKKCFTTIKVAFRNAVKFGRIGEMSHLKNFKILCTEGLYLVLW